MIDICRLTAETIAAPHAPAGGSPPPTPPR